MKVFSGNANLPLAEGIGKYLGLPLAQARIRRFSEVFVEILENVRGERCALLRAASPPGKGALGSKGLATRTRTSRREMPWNGSAARKVSWDSRRRRRTTRSAPRTA